MNLLRRRLLLTTALATMLPAVRAEDPRWPQRPLRLVAGGAGSITDIRARWLAERLAPALGQPVLVENKAGAGGTIAAAQVARSAPDGYTLLVIHQGTAAVAPHLYASPGYDPLADFAPITRLGIGALVLTVHPDTPAASVAELIALARARPGELSYGSPGVGTPPHLASELFARAAGIRAVHVPYKSGGELMTDLIGKRITWSMEGPTAQLPHVRAGRLRPLGVTGAHRLAALPEVPTIAEAGLPGYEYQGWTGIAAPAATPGPVLARLHAEIARIAQSAAARDWFLSLGAEPGELAPDEFAAFIRAEHAAWGRLIREAGLRAE